MKGCLNLGCMFWAYSTFVSIILAFAYDEKEGFVGYDTFLQNLIATILIITPIAILIWRNRIRITNFFQTQRFKSIERLLERWDWFNERACENGGRFVKSEFSVYFWLSFQFFRHNLRRTKLRLIWKSSPSYISIF